MLEKILTFSHLAMWREAHQGRLVVTNGCFDVLHVGHVTLLEDAYKLGDTLLVGIDSDANVRRLKGDKRPVNPEFERAKVVAALECVSFVTIFPDECHEFLAVARPDIYVKSGEWATVKPLDPRERLTLKECNATIYYLPQVTGKSSTKVLEKI